MPQPNSPLVGQTVDLERARTWRWPTTAMQIPRSAIHEFLPVSTPRLGDVALVQVASVGATTITETFEGCNMSIFPGTVIVGVFAPRYAPDEFEGVLPETLAENDEICLLNRGGTIGLVASRNSQFGEPTRVKVLAFLGDRHGKLINTLDYGKKTSDKPWLSEVNDRHLIVVVGTSMNSGKSSTAKAIVYGLTASGHRVVAGKATGQGARRDIFLMRAAGAVEVTDFVDFGYPSTYLLPETEAISLFWRIYNDLHDKAGPDGYIVIELADGIFQRETAMLLRDKAIQAQIAHLVFSSCDSLSAVAGVSILVEDFGLTVSAISGPAANSQLGLREVQQFLGDLPAFNNMVMDVACIAKIFEEPTLPLQTKLTVEKYALHRAQQIVPIGIELPTQDTRQTKQK